MERILIYYPPNKSSVAIETLCKAIKEAGHELIVLTLTEHGTFHAAVEKMGIPTFSYVLPRKPSWKYWINQVRYLVSFCKQHNIDAVWSHLQEANIIAVLAQPFIKAKVVAFRHHAESAFYAEYGAQFGMVRSKNEIHYDNLINRLAKKIVVPSLGVWYAMEKYEDCNMKKVVLLPYIYDFSTYAKPDSAKVAALRTENSCRLLLIMVSRMITSKQHRPVFEIVRRLIEEGLSIKMLVMDDGPLRGELESFVKANQLERHIIFVGFRNDFVNYMDAADLLMHPSLTEASSNVVKEMGLLKKGVAVCEGVGDFDDYIKDGENGYMLQRNDLERTIETAIRSAYNEKEKLQEIGNRLREDVLNLFSDTKANRQRFINLI